MLLSAYVSAQHNEFQICTDCCDASSPSVRNCKSSIGCRTCVMLYLSIRAIVRKPKFMVAPSMAPSLREKDFFAAVKALALT